MRIDVGTLLMTRIFVVHEAGTVSTDVAPPVHAMTSLRLDSNPLRHWASLAFSLVLLTAGCTSETFTINDAGDAATDAANDVTEDVPTPGREGGACVTDNRCTLGFECLEGVCRSIDDRPEGGTECVDEFDCDLDFICFRGHCVQMPCAGAPDCPEGTACSSRTLVMNSQQGRFCTQQPGCDYPWANVCTGLGRPYCAWFQTPQPPLPTTCPLDSPRFWEDGE